MNSYSIWPMKGSVSTLTGMRSARPALSNFLMKSFYTICAQPPRTMSCGTLYEHGERRSGWEELVRTDGHYALQRLASDMIKNKTDYTFGNETDPIPETH